MFFTYICSFVCLDAALDTACQNVKKQVVELLSALCVYSQDGRQRAIDTLHIYQVFLVLYLTYDTYMLYIYYNVMRYDYLPGTLCVLT